MDLLIEFKKYLSLSKKKHSKITVKNYLADVRKFINWFEETFHREFIPTFISREIAKAYKSYITNPNLHNQIPAARSAKRYLSSLKKFYYFLISIKAVNKNPFEDEIQPNDIKPDLFHLKEFKNYLLLSHASKVTIKNYMMDISQFTNWLKNLTKQNNLTGLNNFLIEEYKNRLLYNAYFSPASINRKLSSLRKYLSWLKDQAIIQNEILFEQISSTSKDIQIKQNIAQKQETLKTQVKAEDSEFIYSNFPPLRMLQKLFLLGNSFFDLLFLLPLVKLILAAKHELWKITGRKVFIPHHRYGAGFTTPLDNVITRQQYNPSTIKGLPKAFYAPLKISTKDMPLHRKIYHHLRHARPVWYRKYHSYPVVHYFHFGILLVYVIFLGFTIYHNLVQSQQSSQAVLGSTDSYPRLIAFSGRLTDAANSPITKESPLRFTLYNDKIASGSSLLWEETQVVKPDHDGKFKTLLGRNQSISQDFLNNNPNLFLGITIGNDPELYPRQQIATISYSNDSEKLQGMLPITDPAAGTSNIILALDSSGNLTIGGNASPKFEATGGEFILSGQTLTLKTTDGSNTNIQISPDGAGIIDIQKPLQNTTNYGIVPETEGMVQIKDSLGIIAESSTQSALLINQNSVGNLISAYSNGTAKFTVDYLGSATFAQDLTINGNNLISTSDVFSLVDKNVNYLNIGGDAISISIGASSGTTFINNNLQVGSQSAFLQQITAYGDVIIPESKLGIGTTTPLYQLDAQATQAASVVSQIFNTDTGTDADGMIIKLGASTASTTNKFISFQTAAGEISSITGNGSNGIEIRLPAAFADWAEFIDKDPNETIPFGSLVCIKEDGNVTTCDESENKILGIASERPTIIAGENKGDASIAVGLTGLVKAFVSSENGNIKPGDLITYSENPGVGVKAIQKGMVVGRALERYNNSNVNEVGTILVSLQVMWYDPETKLTSSGNLKDQTTSTLNSQLSTLNSPTLSPILSNLIDNITTGFFEAKNISTQSLSIATENITIGSQTLKEYIQSVVTENLKSQISNLKSELASSQNIPTPTPTISSISQISPTSPTPTSLPVATIAAQTNITNITNIYNSISTPSAEPSVDHEATRNATPSGATEITNTNIASTSSLVDSLNPKPYTLNPDFPTFEQGVLALGASSLNEVSITGNLHLGQSTVFSENTINTIGTNLELQPLRQGNLSMMGELMVIDTEGNLKISGNATFAKNVEVKGVLSANIISPVPDSDLIIRLTTNDQRPTTKFMIHDSNNNEVLNINSLGNLIASGSGKFKNIITDGLSIVRGAQADTSFTETVASGSAGTVIITAYETERTIKTPFVKENSLIYISPISNTQGITPYVARQVAESKNSKGSFTIQIPRFVTKDIKINWWIVN